MLALPAHALAAEKHDEPTATHLVQENSDGIWRSIADWPQGTEFPFKVVGTLPDTLAQEASYEYWLVAKPETLISYIPGTARVEVAHAGGTSQDVTSALSVSCSNGTITAGAADIKSAIPGLRADDTLVLYYTCEYNPNYNLGFGHGNPSWAHVEYASSGSVSQASLEPAGTIATQASARARSAGSDPASDTSASPAVLRPAGGIAAQAADSPSSNLSRSPDVKATVYCYALDLVKLAGDTGKPLAGAGFALCDDEGLWYVEGKPWSADAADATIMTTGSDGTLLFSGLDADGYTLVEARAPKGYDALNPIAIDTTSGIPQEREWLKAASEDVTVTGVDSEKGTIGVSATDPRSGKGGPDDPDDSGAAGAGSGNGAKGPGSDDASGEGVGGRVLALMGDSAPWVLVAAAIASACMAGTAWRRSRQRRLEFGKQPGASRLPAGR